MSSNIVFGLDIGSSKFISLSNEGEALVSETGSITRPSLISFYDRSRQIGDEAAAYIGGENTINRILSLIGMNSLQEIQQTDYYRHMRVKLHDENGAVYALVTYNGQEESISLPALLAILLGKVAKRIFDVAGSDTRIALVLPVNSTPLVIKSIQDACFIAGLESSRVDLHHPEDCLVAAYNRKLSALKPAEQVLLVGRNVLIVEMGYSHVTCALLKIVSVETTAPETGKVITTTKGEVVTINHLPVGSFQFDCAMFDHFAQHVFASKHRVTVEPGSKKGLRLLTVRIIIIVVKLLMAHMCHTQQLIY